MADDLKNTIAQSLECPVCLNIFKDPKILSCSHTFCKACLDNLVGCHGNEQMVRCPVCRANTQVPNQDVSQLQTNLALKSLIEDVERKQQVCTNCKSEEKPHAVVYCQDCGKYLCIACQTKHAQWEGFSDHEVIGMSDIESGKVSVRRFRKCRKHPREDEECFCTHCRRFACFRCGIMEHKDEGHRVIEASAYETNHLKSVQDLKSNADKKVSRIQKYIDFIDEQRDLVNTTKSVCIDDINDAYEESVRQLIEKKELLIGEVTRRTTEVDAELDKMKKEAQQQISQINIATDLVANGTKIPVELDALAAHDTLCQELQDALKLDDPDVKLPGKSSRKGKCIVFERDACVNELGLGKITNAVAKNVALPTKDSMNSMVPTQDGRMIVGCKEGGIQIFSVDGQLQQTVLEKVKVREIGFLSDGRCAVRDTENSISIYTTEWEKLNVRFQTLDHEEGGYGGLDVDSDDHIYVAYTKAEKIQVFSLEGGKAIREIPYKGNSPWQIKSYDQFLLIGGGSSTIHMTDTEGTTRHELTKSGGRLLAANTHDDLILIAWVNMNKDSVDIGVYNKDLHYIKTIISDYKIEKPKRKWYYLQEFRSGEIAFCTPDRLYIIKNVEI